jgi:hypothetical protein
LSYCKVIPIDFKQGKQANVTPVRDAFQSHHVSILACTVTGTTTSNLNIAASQIPARGKFIATTTAAVAATIPITTEVFDSVEHIRVSKP